MEVVDVDGSYLYRKHKVVADAGMRVAPLPLPSPPLSGWESVSQENVAEVAKKVPHVTSGWYVQAHRYASSARLHAYISSLCNVGVVYTYLASGAGRSAGEGTFRALTRGFIHWQSGRIDKLEVNVQHPLFCHVRSQMKPSMRPGTYHVYVLLGRDNDFATVISATCECAAGYV